MGRWSRAELEEAFHNYEQAVVEIGKTWDWASYADHFTEDAAYVEHGKDRPRADPGVDLIDDEHVPR